MMDRKRTSIIGKSSRFSDLIRMRNHLHLVHMLALREIISRYKQSYFGLGLVILQPVMMLVVFGFLFGKIANIDTGETPYLLFSAAGILPWMFMQKSIVNGGISLVSFGGIFSKVPVPRLVAPLTMVYVSLIDLLISFVVLAGVMLYFGILPPAQIFLLPVAIAYGAFVSLSVSLWAAGFCVNYRDVKHMFPYVIQALMYFSPVAYPSSAVPDGILKTVFNLNPVAGYLDFFRWVLIGTPPSDWAGTLFSIGLCLVLLMGGLIYFSNVSRTFADRL